VRAVVQTAAAKLALIAAVVDTVRKFENIKGRQL